MPRMNEKAELVEPAWGKVSEARGISPLVLGHFSWGRHVGTSKYSVLEKAFIEKIIEVAGVAYPSKSPHIVFNHQK